MRPQPFEAALPIRAGKARSTAVPAKKSLPNSLQPGNSAGALPTGSEPKAARRSRTSGCDTIFIFT
jgi:hypothetical protein